MDFLPPAPLALFQDCDGSQAARATPYLPRSEPARTEALTADLDLRSPRSSAYVVVLTGFGVLIALVAWLQLSLKRLSLSFPIICIALRDVGSPGRDNARRST